jgi:hypothetical protein
MVEFRVVDDETYALVKLPGFCFVAELRQTRPVLQAFNIDVMGGMAELTLGRQRTPKDSSHSGWQEDLVSRTRSFRRCHRVKSS